MKNKNNHSKRNFWIIILGFLGFPSCLPTIAEYGTPSATFKVNGCVKNAQTEQPIADLKVLMKKKFEYPDTSFISQLDSATTNEKGEFNLKATEFPNVQEFILQFVDADGEKNGLFEDHDTIVSFKDLKFRNGDGHWYDGEATKEVEITLKPL